MKLKGILGKQVVTLGIGGILLAISYHIISMSNISQKKNHKLSESTEVLHLDDELFSLFCRLQKYEEIDKQSFESSVDNADRLVFICIQLKKNEIQSTLQDRPEAFKCFKMAVNSIENILNTCQRLHIPRVYVEIHRLYSSIYECLQVYWTDVLKLTNEINDF